MDLLLQMNVVAAVLIVAIVIIRALALYKFPKKTFIFFWGVVALRLLIPFRMPRPFDLFPSQSTVPSGMTSNTSEMIYAGGTAAQVSGTVEQTAPVSFSFEAVWIIGICVAAIFFLVSYLRFRREANASLPCENAFAAQWLAERPLRRSIRIRQTDRISAPLTYGVLRPVILLPQNTDWQNEDALRCILTHEYVHIRRFDTLTKLVFAAVVCFHWFNPLVWVMYILANRDIELSCDEAVTDELGAGQKTNYLHVLIALEETKTRMAFPLASHFGKHAIKERMSAIMKKGKYTVPVIITAVALVLCSGVFAAFALSADAPSEDLILCEDLSQKEAAEIKALFEDEGIDEYRMDGSTLYVSNEEYAKSRALVWMHGLQPADYEYDIYYGEDLPLEERDLDYLLTLQDRLEEAIEEFDGVEEAAVVISIGRKTGPTVPVTVTMEDENAELTAEQVTAICKLIQGAVGNITENKIHITDSRGGLYLMEEQMTPLDGYEEVITDGQINYDSEHTGTETTVRTPTETELEVMSQLKNKLNTFSGIEVIAIAAETTDQGKITVDIKLAEGNDLTNAQLRELMDLFYSIVPIEQAGQLGVSAVVKEEVIPYGELGSQTYEPSYILPDSSGGVIGVEGNEDLPTYVEGDSGQEIFVPEQSDFDPAPPSWSDNEN